jgi:hypothetical protein
MLLTTTAGVAAGFTLLQRERFCTLDDRRLNATLSLHHHAGFPMMVGFYDNCKPPCLQ